MDMYPGFSLIIHESFFTMSIRVVHRTMETHVYEMGETLNTAVAIFSLQTL